MVLVRAGARDRAAAPGGGPARAAEGCPIRMC